jgi:iron-sulfur cluster assembly protein
MMTAAQNPAPTSPAGPPPAVAAPDKRTIVLTQAAADEIARQRAKRNTPNARIRVGVRGGGCTGFTYVFEWADEVRATDKEFFGPEIDQGQRVSIVVDPKSLVFLGGMTLDFVRGMMGHGFKFNNPNAKGSCGCGESVQF